MDLIGTLVMLILRVLRQIELRDQQQESRITGYLNPDK